jgi:hypothetical protein
MIIGYRISGNHDEDNASTCINYKNIEFPRSDKTIAAVQNECIMHSNDNGGLP